MEFNLSSGTTIIFKDDKIEIDRKGSTRAQAALHPDRTVDKIKMYIKAKSITGAVLYYDMLIILGQGLPTFEELGTSKVNDIRNLPNTITGKDEELNQVYETIMSLNV
ncbi:hypothetical protein JOC70_000749 [Clostridium pascui]|uniref:hypothetical protein n=1 Tax=Clostridium pascui TaxID=46609 RepID=UPI0019589912|nr:hypothetical protein [Clostridium pascui]MBM7869280.1 hypothetical protein [Clostridium pascui]